MMTMMAMMMMIIIMILSMPQSFTNTKIDVNTKISVGVMTTVLDASSSLGDAIISGRRLKVGDREAAAASMRLVRVGLKDIRRPLSEARR